MTWTSRLPNPSRIVAKTIASELARLRRASRTDRGSRSFLGKAHEALYRIFTSLGKPRFTPRPLDGERDLGTYNEMRRSIADDLVTVREEQRGVAALLDAQFNVAKLHSAELLALSGKALSKVADLAILQGEESLTALAAGDDFLDRTKIDDAFPSGSSPAFVDTREGIVTLSRVATENVIDPDTVDITIEKVSPDPDPTDVDRVQQLYTLYEGKFAALLGQAEPEGGKWHFEDAPADETEEGYEYKLDVIQTITKDGKVVVFGEEGAPAQTEPDVTIVGENGAANPIGLVGTQRFTDDPTAGANQILTRDMGATEEEKKRIRRRMVDGEPDSYWQCEYAIRPPELADRGLKAIALGQETPSTSPITESVDPEGLRRAARTLDNTDLIVAVTLTLPEPADLNWLSLLPMNFGESAWLRVRSVKVADGRSGEFVTVPGFDDSVFSNILADDVNSEIDRDTAGAILSPGVFSHRGSGVWTFPTLRVQKIRFELVQEVPVPVLYQRINVQMHRLREAVDDYVRSSDQQTKETKKVTTEEWTKIVALTYLQSVRIFAGSTTVTDQSPGSSPSYTGSGNSAADQPSGLFDNTHGRTSTWVDSENDTGWYVRSYWEKTYYDRVAYRMGIREVGAYRMRYAQRSEVVSRPYVSPVEIRKVTLRVDDHAPDGTSIRYELSPDDGKTWYRVNPLDKPTVHGSDGYALPRVLSFNVPGVAPEEQKYVVTENPVRRLRLRAVLETASDVVTPILRRYRIVFYPDGDLSQVN